ncbi:MAG TPA: hypothetical protein VGZ29_16810 [Terriglobia bacterium]|nr:hypothetical protein [Terriglobia bacterium]
MKDSKQVVKEYALRSISDDYENLETIFADVTDWSAHSGSQPDRESVVAAVQELVQGGYAQAYRFDPPFKEAIPTEYSTELVDELWFYVTSEGKRLACALKEHWR